MNNFAEWFSTASAGLALSALLVSLAAVIRARVEAGLQLRSLRGADVEAVLDSSELDRLGALLVDRLGQTTLADYSKNDKLRESFQEVFDEVVRYLGQEETSDRASEDVEVGPESADRVSGTSSPLADEEVKRAIDAVSNGETWNALAMFRRRLELELRAIAISSGLDVEKRQHGAGALLHLLARQGSIDASIARELRYAVSIANNAIHGAEVDPGEALEAIQIIDRFVRSRV